MHNLIAVLLLATAMVTPPSVSTTPQAVQRRDSIAALLSPSAKQKVHAIAASLASSSSITDGTTRAAIFSNFGSIGDADISALAFLVLMEASKSAQQDLQTIMDQVNAINKAKEGLRAELAKVNQTPPATTTASIHKVQAQMAPRLSTLPPPLPPNATVAQKQNRFDALNDLEQQDMLQLQQAMDRKQTLETMISSLLKNLHDVRAATISNIR
jgi:hypothetical protein